MEILVVLIACLLSKGHGAVNFVDPTNGTMIVDFEGTLENAVTITCNITNGGIQIGTTWSLENFRNNPYLQTLSDEFVQTISELSIDGDLRPSGTSTFRNRLTISVLSSELERIIIHCGTGQQPRQASFPVRVYRPPNLQDNLVLNIVENTVSVPVKLSQGPAAFPEPTLYSWSKDGQILNNPTLTYSSVTFSPLRRSDTGNYLVSATNYILGSNTEQVGNDTGSFFLNVIYEPSFRQLGPAQQYALFNESLSLVCGTDLISNPPAMITWTAPNGTTIAMNIAGYSFDNGPDNVRLNFSQTSLNDTGVWVCDIRVMTGQYVVSNGSLVPVDPTLIGEAITHNIQLTIIGPPSLPVMLSVEATGATYIRVCWEQPLDILSPISYYLINVANLNSTGGIDNTIRNTTTDKRDFNITGLLPGTTYQLIVMAVSRGGEIMAKSEASGSVTLTTGLTVPALMCDDPEFSMGGITARWSYIHTGGQDLTSVLVSYTFQQGSVDSDPLPVMNSDPTITFINVPKLTAGIRYTFNITAVNDIGSSSVLCGPTLVNIGIPLIPTFGDLLPGSSATEIRIQIETVASGESPDFRFNIIPVHNGIEDQRHVFMLDDYQSGTFVTLTIQDLMEGGTYTFRATAQNSFGESGVATSLSIVIIPSPAQQDGNNAAIVGGVVGVLSVIIIVVITTIFVVLLLIKGKSTASGKTEVPTYDEPDNLRWNTSNSSDIELKECPAYEKLRKDAHIELEQCPAYGELQRNPSRC